MAHTAHLIENVRIGNSFDSQVHCARAHARLRVSLRSSTHSPASPYPRLFRGIYSQKRKVILAVSGCQARPTYQNWQSQPRGNERARAQFLRSHASVSYRCRWIRAHALCGACSIELTTVVLK